MSKPKIVLGLLGAFLVGCVASQMTAFVVPPARAGTSPQRWEYMCKQAVGEGTVTDMANQFGTQGWEMAAVAGLSPQNAVWCFKRAL
jgi:hypothetical protein